MHEFRYEARDDAGHPVTGTMQATSAASASEQLRARRLFILSVTQSATAQRKSLLSMSFSLGPGLKDVQAFTTQLAVMVKAGISLRAALEGIAEQTPNAKFRDMLENVRRDVEGGKQFSDAISRYPKTFGTLYINMIKASELSGGFSRMLDRIANHLTHQIETISMVRGAMVYPGIIGTMAIGTAIFMLTFVLPRFMTIFAGKEDMLPAPTKALLWLSAFMTHSWYLIVAGLAALIWGLVLGLRTDRGRVIFDTLKLRVPFVKKLFRALYISRSLNTMGQLLSAGVPMLETISITADISGNVLYKRLWRSVQNAVKQGKPLTFALQRSTLLPKAVVQMVGAGEESGKLGDVLDSVSEYYLKELRATIKTMTSMIEPAMIVAMGSMVGFIAMSVILPIFKMSQIMK